MASDSEGEDEEDDAGGAKAPLSQLLHWAEGLVGSRTSPTNSPPHSPTDRPRASTKSGTRQKEARGGGGGEGRRRF
jgi:hypothetical protein